MILKLVRFTTRYEKYEKMYSKQLGATEYKYLCSELMNKYPKLKETVELLCEEKNKNLLLGKIDHRQNFNQPWVCKHNFL